LPRTKAAIARMKQLKYSKVRHVTFRVRFTVRRIMIAVAVIAVILGFLMSVRRWRSSSASDRLLLYAEYHRIKSSRWESCAKLSEQRVTSLLPIRRGDGTRGELLQLNHFVPRRRPTDAAKAEMFDRECAAIAAKCWTMARYHEGLRRKWEYLAWHPWATIERDPPPPLPLEQEENTDRSY
jgi:hypothetical protein